MKKKKQSVTSQEYQIENDEDDIKDSCSVPDFDNDSPKFMNMELDQKPINIMMLGGQNQQLSEIPDTERDYGDDRHNFEDIDFSNF